MQIKHSNRKALFLCVTVSKVLNFSLQFKQFMIDFQNPPRKKSSRKYFSQFLLQLKNELAFPVT